MFDKIKTIITSGSERSQIVKRNAVGALLVKMFSMCVDFAKTYLRLLGQYTGLLTKDIRE